MACQNERRSISFFSVSLSLNLMLIAGLVIQVGAQSAPVIPGKTIVSVTFEPLRDGKPDDSAGGASRNGGICPQDTQLLGPSVTPLRPATHSELTVSEHPTFFVYVPQTSAGKALFVLKDDNEDYYYQKIIPMNRSGGIVSFKLPEDAPKIEVGKTYQWSFVMMCGETIRPDNPTVEGRIQRIAPNPALSSQLKSLSAVERAALYGKNGIWYDTLTSLAQQRRSQPKDSTLAATWEKLLKSVGLEAIATKPLLQ